MLLPNSYNLDSIVCETSSAYYLDNSNKPTINNEHDKIFRKILDNKKEAVYFLNKTLNLKYKLKQNEIEKYNSSFVTDTLENSEADIIYKLKNKNVFFLIEHQTKIDYTMPIRILSYEYDIIKSALDEKKCGKKKYKLPLVISIVLYSGRTKWNVKDCISDMQETLKGYSETKFAKYNIVDVNNVSEDDLLKEKSLLSKALLLEKTRYSNDLVVYLEKIVLEVNSDKKVYSKEQKKILKTIINLVLRRKLENVKAEELIKKLEGGDGNMLAVLEMIDEENRRLIATGEKRGIIIGEKRGERRGQKQGKRIEKIETVKKMLIRGFSIETISDITELTEKEIQKYADELLKDSYNSR